MNSVLRRRTLVAWLAAGTGLGNAVAQPAVFPAGTVRLIVPFPAGGATDVMARMMAEQLTRKWGQPVVVENRPGGYTIPAMDIVAKAAPDGRTLAIVGGFSYSVNPLLVSKLPYDTQKDITGVMLLTRNHLALYAHPSFPADNIAEMVALAKRDPARVSYAYATPGVFLGMELFNSMAGTRMGNVPYKGAAQAMNDLLGGHIQLLVDVLSPGAVDHARTGKLKIIGTLGAAPAALMPGVSLPASAVPGFELTGSFCILTRGGTPSSLVRRIRDDFAAVLQLPEVAARIRDLGQEPIASTPEEFHAYAAAEARKYEPIVRATGIRLD